MPELLIDASGLEVVALQLSATPKQCKAALRSTLKKIATWLKSLSIKGLSKELDIAQKVLRRRLKSFRLREVGDGGTIALWYGLDPIALIYLGPRRTATGVTAGKRKVAGAFIANGVNGNKQVFKREGAKRVMSKGVNAGKLKQPLKKQVADIKDKAETWIEDRLIGAAAFEKRFLDTFEHELKWRTQTPT